MKRNFKFVVASAIAMSALTPAAVFAIDTPAPAAKASTGFYTADSFFTPGQFKALSKKEQQDLLRTADLVLVVAGTVYFAKDALGKSDAELEKIAISEADFEAKHGELTKSGYGEEVDAAFSVLSID